MKIRAKADTFGLTKDETYDLIEDTGGHYKIKSDNGNIEEYYKWRFEIVEELPKKWCIISDRREHDSILNEYARKAGGIHWNDTINHSANFYLHIDNGEYVFGTYEKDEKYTEITFEQFQKLVLKENKKDMKIIGYTLLKDIVDTKAGTLVDLEGNYTPTEESDMDEFDYQFNPDKLSNTEWFSPIYEDEFIVGEWVVITQDHKHYNDGKYQNAIGKYISGKPSEDEYKFYVDVPYEGRIACMEIRKATEEEIRKATEVTINDYTAKKEGELIAFGCQKFTSNELVAYKKLLNSSIKAQIQIYGVYVTEEMLDKLLNL
jgi:hypothetical protein